MTRLEKLYYRLILTLAYLAVATILLNIFMTEHGFRADQVRNSFGQMVEYETHRPFAYRVLTPMLINGIESLFPEESVTEIGDWLSEKSPLINSASADTSLESSLILKFHIAYI